MEESGGTRVVCGEREEYDRQRHPAEVVGELVAVCRKGRIWLQRMCSHCLQKVHLTCPGISSPDCDSESSQTSYAKTADLSFRKFYFVLFSFSLWVHTAKLQASPPPLRRPASVSQMVLHMEFTAFSSTMPLMLQPLCFKSAVKHLCCLLQRLHFYAR